MQDTGCSTNAKGTVHVLNSSFRNKHFFCLVVWHVFNGAFFAFARMQATGYSTNAKGFVHVLSSSFSNEDSFSLVASHVFNGALFSFPRDSMSRSH